MANYTIHQAEQVLSGAQPEVPPTVGAPGSTSTTDATSLIQKILAGTATDADLANAVRLNLISAPQAAAYRTNHPQQAPAAPAPDYSLGTFVNEDTYIPPGPLDPIYGDVGKTANNQLKQIGNTFYNYDPITGKLTPAVDAAGNPITESSGGGAGSYGSSAEYLQAQQALQAARDAEAIRQFNLQFPESQRTNDASILGNRANTGLNLGSLVRGLANDSYDRAKDPGNYPAYLAASAGLPQGSGSPISALIGQGTQIQSPEGANPLADPRFQQLLDAEYKYGTVPDPASVGTIRSIAIANGGVLPQAFYDYTGSQNPNVHAQGGTQMLTGPTVGIPQSQLVPGQTPQFLAGEAGPEQIDFTPMHAHTKEAGMPVPHQHEGGHAAHEHMGSMIQYADGGSAITGISPSQHQLRSAWNAYHPNDQQADNVFTPAEGTAMSLGKALQPLGYVPGYVIQQLMSGNAPTPGSIDEATLSRLPPSLRALLQAQIRSQLGSAGVDDYNFQLQQNALPGLKNGGITSTVYSA